MDIRTLFIGSLPPDATNRELRLLFSTSEGYIKSMIVNKDGNSLYGFVTFDSSEAAEKAREYYDGYEYDTDIFIRVTPSKRNTPDWFSEKVEGISKQAKVDNSGTQRTLYITGFPKQVTPEYFSLFITANFSGQITGYELSSKKRAFVGFGDPYSAKHAREKLNNHEFTFEGVTSTLHCDFANTEFIPRGDQLPLTLAQAPSLPKNQNLLIPGSKTVFVSATKSLDQSLLEPSLRKLFGDQIETLSFGGKEKTSAFILFSTSEQASAAIEQLHNSEIPSMPGVLLKASLARTELVPRNR
eukprot:TRINITY_DN3645_c0_g2_i1.p1 TRINITY_DN3645_c0_g2~~TRINITY_DN3645_c0_g2_i1.p1  ORF type:complete len:299 (+),score=28.82 TRINITY_DN3645_c0_g2_i1:57-953(+)